MGIKKQRKVHKTLANYNDRIDAIEYIMRVILWAGLAVFLGGFVITCAIDPIRQRIWEVDWLQITGMIAFLGLSGICSFLIWAMRK